MSVKIGDTQRIITGPRILYFPSDRSRQHTQHTKVLVDTDILDINF